MDNGDPHEEIVYLEARIEQLGQEIENCRKVGLAARAAFIVGAVLFCATILGLIAFNPTVLIAALAAMIGGIVLLGSNRSTANQANAALKTAEARRAALIAMIDPRIVGATVH
jgi:predicted benzoate:H+ symporter BenE